MRPMTFQIHTLTSADGTALHAIWWEPDDDPAKAGIVLAMTWAVVGMFVGDWVAWLLAYPDMTFDAAWASFGRLRPVHTTGVIFASAFPGYDRFAEEIEKYALHRGRRDNLLAL